MDTQKNWRQFLRIINYTFSKAHHFGISLLNFNQKKYPKSPVESLNIIQASLATWPHGTPTPHPRFTAPGSPHGGRKAPGFKKARAMLTSDRGKVAVCHVTISPDHRITRSVFFFFQRDGFKQPR